MTAFLVSTGAVAIAEIGDKTQLLALLLALRFRRPAPIFLGILLATLANHGLAGLAGAWLGSLLDGDGLRWALAASFIVVALWTLVPDAMEKDPSAVRRGSAFLVTLVSFFLVEIGDKTQVATIVLAARFDALAAVVLGTTAGLLLANTPVVLFGHAIAERVPLRTVRWVAAAVFALLGVAALVDLAL